MKEINLLAVLTAVLLTSGCATLFSDDVQHINFSSKESGSIILTDDSGSRQIDVPDSILITKGMERVSYRVDGCALEQNVNRKIAPWFWGNILSGGVGGSAIDYATGSMWKYQYHNNVEIDTTNVC